MLISDIKPLLAISVKAEDFLVLEGESGIGKSQIINDFAKDNHMCIEPLHLGSQEVGDLIGIPDTSLENGVKITVWDKPYWLHRLHEAAWPSSGNIEDLIFEDEEFKNIIYEKFNDKGIISKTDLTYEFINFYKLDINDRECLTSRQKKVKNKKSKQGLLFLDEFNRATPDVKGVMLQLITEKRIHQHVLPYVNGIATAIVGAINPVNSEYGLTYDVNKCDAALVDRALKVKVYNTAEAWLCWARNNNINQLIIEFIATNPQYLYNVPKNDRAATPRSWAKLSDHLNLLRNMPLDETSVTTIINGKIGVALGAKFYSCSNMLTLEKVLEIVDSAIAVKIPDLKVAKGVDILGVGSILKRYFRENNIDQAIIIEKWNQFYKIIKNKGISSLSNKEILRAYGILYGLEIETLAGAIYSMREDLDLEVYGDFAEYDNIMTKKALYLSLFERSNQ